MKRVIFDVDGVLSEFTLGFRQLANAHFGVPIYGDEQQRTWEMGDLTPAQDSFLWDTIKESHGFWENLPLGITQYQADRIMDLADRRDRTLYFVTSRVGDSAKRETEEWLKNHLRVYNPTVIVSNRKHLIADAIKADFCIDDKFENAVSIGFTYRKIKSFLLTKPYNQGFESTHAIRINSLNAYLDAIE